MGQLNTLQLNGEDCLTVSLPQTQSKEMGQFNALQLKGED